MVTIGSENDRTLSFDFLPINFKIFSDLRLRVQLFTVPGKVSQNTTRKLVLKEADGIVFVADSDPEKMDENIESLNFKQIIQQAKVGTNALMQARQFSSSCGVNGMCVTKLDGSGKGGVVVAIKEEMDIPIHFVGLGESQQDLQPFDAQMFAEAMFSE